MSKLSAMTEDLTTQLSIALSQIKVRDFKNISDYVKARHEILSAFNATRKEMMNAVEQLNSTAKTRF